MRSRRGPREEAVLDRVGGGCMHAGPCKGMAAQTAHHASSIQVLQTKTWLGHSCAARPCSPAAHQRGPATVSAHLMTA